MAGNVVEVILEMRRVGAFVRDATQASDATAKVGREAETSGKRAQAGYKGLAKWAAGAGLVYGASHLLKSAVSSTEDLAKSTLALQRQTNLDTQTASEWVGVLKERNVSVRTFQTGLKTLSKAMESSRLGTSKQSATVANLRKQIDLVAAAGGKNAPKELAKLSAAIVKAQTSGDKSRKALGALGISMDAIRKGNTKEVLLETADAISKMTNPAQRSTAAQALLGRSGIALLPVLMKGRKGIEEMLGMQHRYGNYIGGKGMSNAKKLIAQQREMEAAWNGAKVQLGQALLPVLTQVAGVLVSVARVMQPLTRHATLFKVALGLLAGAMVAYKAMLVASTIAQTIFNAELGVTETLLTGGVVLAIIALAAGFVLLYKKVGWFRAAVNATWGWIKDHWKLLVGILIGPIGVAVYEIVKHWKQVKAGAVDVFNWIKSNWPYLVAALFGPFGLATVAIVKHFGAIKRVALGFAHAVRHAFVAAFDAVKAAARGALDFVIRGWNKLHFRIPGFKVGPVHFGGFVLGMPKVPLLADGGLVRGGGTALVGERGPELVTLPAGAAVQPLPQPALAGPGWGGRPLEIRIPVILDGREIARAVARVAADQLARR